MNQTTHIYVHLPFCSSRCAYCDFYSETEKTGLAPEYIGALMRELEESDLPAGLIKTVYLGGGTPTLIGGELLGRLLDALSRYTQPGAEITVEANPGTVTQDLARDLADAGVTRVSVGVQSFDARLRHNLGRAGKPGEGQRALDILRGVGFKNLGIDLIFGIPGQGIADLRSDLRAALALEPEHVSYYELTVKEGSPYWRRWREELQALEPHSRLFYETVVDTLQAAGYRWYETSNFSLPGYECRHNIAYWKGADYIGLGAGAWSTVGLRRWRNAGDVSEYLQAAGVRDIGAGREHESLTGRERLMERFALGLRRPEGLKRSAVSALIDPEQESLLEQAGLIQALSPKLALTREGRFVADEVTARLLIDGD